MEHIAVIVPCHNNAAHVSAALGSIKRQSHAAAEIVVVDDGSVDASREIVRGLGGVRLIVQPNRGAAAARNAGVAVTLAPLIAFLDADDLWTGDSLGLRLAAMAQSGADLVYGGIAQCDGSGEPLGPAMPGRLAGALLMRRAVFEAVGPFDESLATAETVDWVARADALGIRMAACAGTVLYRRIHGGNLMLRTQRPDRNALTVLRRAVERRRAEVRS